MRLKCTPPHTMRPSIVHRFHFVITLCAVCFLARMPHAAHVQCNNVHREPVCNVHRRSRFGLVSSTSHVASSPAAGISLVGSNVFSNGQQGLGSHKGVTDRHRRPNDIHTYNTRAHAYTRTQRRHGRCSILGVRLRGWRVHAPPDAYRSIWPNLLLRCAWCQPCSLGLDWYCIDVKLETWEGGSYAVCHECKPRSLWSCPHAYTRA